MATTLLDPYEFGRQLLESKDLDPTYVLIWEAGLSQEELRRWLISYWSFYSVGTACWITEGDIGFWDRMETAARSKEYPRGAERRHYRGDNAIESVAWLKSQGLDKLFQWTLRTDLNLKRVMDIIQQWKEFGPWIAFKVADMTERLGMVKIEFAPDDVFHIFEAPVKGARLMWDTHWAGPKNGDTMPILNPASVKDVCRWAHDKLLQKVGTLKAPPRYERTINIQEIETILCKWKSHMTGHYEVGKDTHEIREGLMKFARCRLAQKLLKAGKKGRLW